VKTAAPQTVRQPRQPVRENRLQFITASQHPSVFVNGHHRSTTSDIGRQRMWVVGNDSHRQEVPSIHEMAVKKTTRTWWNFSPLWAFASPFLHIGTSWWACHDNSNNELKSLLLVIQS